MPPLREGLSVGVYYPGNEDFGPGTYGGEIVSASGNKATIKWIPSIPELPQEERLPAPDLFKGPNFEVRDTGPLSEKALRLVILEMMIAAPFHPLTVMMMSLSRVSSACLLFLELNYSSLLFLPPCFIIIQFFLNEKTTFFFVFSLFFSPPPPPFFFPFLSSFFPSFLCIPLVLTLSSFSFSSFLLSFFSLLG